MRDMFATAIQSGQIELFVDYQANLAQQRTPHTVVVYQSKRGQRQVQDRVQYDDGPSRHNEVSHDPANVGDDGHGFGDDGPGFGDGGSRFGDGGLSPHNEVSDDSESEDLVSEKSTTPPELSEESEANQDASDNETLNVPRRYVPVVPPSEQEYEHPGLSYFRTLPTTEGNYYESNHDDSESSSWFWDEKNPTRIGLGTKFDTKLQLKTAVTLWHLESSTKEYYVVESKPTKWNVECKTLKPPKESESTSSNRRRHNQTGCIWKL